MHMCSRTTVPRYDDDTTTVATAAEKEGLTGAGFAWITLEELAVEAVPQMSGWLYVRLFLPFASGFQTFAAQVTLFRSGFVLVSHRQLTLTVGPCCSRSKSIANRALA